MQTTVATPLMAYALAMLVAMPVPAERASRVPTITLSTRAAITHPLLPAQCSPVDGPLPLMRPQPLAGMCARDELVSRSCARSGGDSRSDAQYALQVGDRARRAGAAVSCGCLEKRFVQTITDGIILLT